MATGGAAKYSRCSPCLDNGRNITARRYCVDCEMYFCIRCVDCHNKIPSLKAHQVNEVISDSGDADDDTTYLQSDVQSESVQRLRCTIHQDKPIDTHCKDHDEVCCGACAMLKHRLCTTVSVAVAAKDFNTSSELISCKEILTDAIVTSNKEKEKRAENLDKLGKQKLELIETVDKYEEKIIAKIKELANTSRDEIRSKYEEHKTTLDMDIEALDVVIATNTEYTKMLEQMDNERQFIYMKTNKTVTKDGEMLLQAMMAAYMELDIKYCFDEALDNQILQMNSFGVLEVECPVKEYRAAFQRHIDIQQNDYKQFLYVHDVCLMDSGELLVTDDDNKKLKRFNSDLEFKDDLLLSDKPVAVCKITNHEVAVRIRNTKLVQFVSIGQSMQLTSAFTLAEDGYGLAYDTNSREIFSCEENRVRVYSKTGKQLRTYDTDTNGEPMFSKCRQIAMSENKQDIYVTDEDKGVIILDKSGQLKKKISILGIGDVWPLCLLPGNICFAGGLKSDMIAQVDKDGRQVENLIDTKDGRNNTFCIVYDLKHSRLIVGGSYSIISVYDLSAK